MQINPVINCSDEATLRSRITIAKTLVGETGVIHLDVADGSFTEGYQTFRDPVLLKKLIFEEKIRVAVHLMVAKPEVALEQWLDTGISRIILHFETLTDFELTAGQCKAHGVEPYLGLTTAAPIGDALQHLAAFDGCLVLAVPPGKTAQQFQSSALEAIKQIHAAMPVLPIAVDGGVTPEIAKQCKTAGATQIAAGAYIFSNAAPAAAYAEFVKATAD
jgi:ribulose-phosphate 3-epimerase